MFPVLDKKPEATGPPLNEQSKQREKQWDERFTVSGGIPEYSPLKDKHTKNYKKSLQSKDQLVNFKNVESVRDSNKKSWSKKKHDAINQRLDVDNVQNNVKINALIKDLEKVWLSEKIPDFYSFYFMEHVKNVAPDRLEDMITREIRSVRNKETHFVDIVKTIEAREACIIQIRKVLENLKALKRNKDEEGFDNKLKTLQDEISHLRKLTLFVIDKIKKWRDWLVSLDPKLDPEAQPSSPAPQFLYGEDNYLLRILDDTNFFSNSLLSDHLVLASKNDPFIMRPLKQERTATNHKYMLVVDCDEELKKRMVKSLEYLANEKAAELRKKLAVARPYERAEVVERVYQSKLDNKERERRAKAKLDVNYETDVEKVEQFRNLEKEKERIQRLQRNQQRINAIKSIYEPKMQKRDYRQPETDNDIAYTNTRLANNSSMPKLNAKPLQKVDKSKSIIAMSVKKLPKKDNQSEFESMLRNKEMEILKEARAPQSIKLKDRLGTKKVMEDKEGMKELEKIVTNYKETKLVNTVKGMDQEIKSKIQAIKEENQDALSAAAPRRPPVSMTILKQNDQLIKQLKNQILVKIQKQAADKERIKRMQRDQQMRMLQQMKVKLRRQFEQRIASQKAKRQAQRQQLQKQLRDEDIKLEQQKRLQLELIAKMNHERDMRQVERIKNKTLEREKELKRKLKEEQAKRLQVEASAKQDKLQLMEELNKKALKETLETELKQELRDKMIRDAEKEAKIEEEKNFQHQKKEIENQMEKLRIKQAMELEELRKSNELRDKLLREKFQLQQRKSLELQQLMKQRMSQQKAQMEAFAMLQRKQMQQKLRQGAKQQLLNELKTDKLIEYDKEKREKERQIEEEVYRDKMREKLEKEMRLDVIKRTKEELEMREIKKQAISQQLERAQAKLEEQVINRPIDKAKIESEVRKEIIEKAIIDKKMEKEIAKQELRNQFEKELLSSGIPEIYTQKHDFLIKDINAYKDDNYLKGKLEQQKVDTSPRGYQQPPAPAPSNQIQMGPGTPQLSKRSPTKRTPSPLPSNMRQPTQSKTIVSSASKLNDSQLTNERTRLGMTEEQYQIYVKKKKAVEWLREDRDRKEVRPIEELEDEGEEFKRVVVGGGKSMRRHDSKKKPDDIEDRVSHKKRAQDEDDEHDRRSKKTKRDDPEVGSKRNKKQEYSEDDSDEAQVIKVKKGKKKPEPEEDSDKPVKIKKKKNDDSDSEEVPKKKKKPVHSSDEQSKKRVSKKKNKNKQDEQQQQDNRKKKTKKSAQKKEESDEQVEPKQKRGTSKKKNDQKSPTKKHNRSFETSDSQALPKKTSRKQKKSKKQQSESQEQEPQDKIVYFDRQEEYEAKEKRNIKTPSLRSRVSAKILPQQVPILEKYNQAFSVHIQALPEGELDEYLGAHFMQLPKEQIQIQTLTRQELYKKLMNEVTFSLLVGSEQGKVSGICIAYHDRSKQQSRKFVITHIGTYKNNHLFDFCINMCQYIFRKDPCDEIQFSFRYDQSKEDQLEFSNDFNGKFDRYGAIFQKKIQDEKYERKYVMKRPFNLKCQVQIGAKSKHTFVNLFSISTSLIVSNMQLVVNKQQNLISRNLAPERQVSYSIMVSQIFRNCLSPQQAETLKNKVKEYLKLKELLVLIVMLEKKKVKLDELKLNEFSTITELNMKLMSQGKELVRIVKDSGVSHNRVFYCELNQAFRLPFHFQTTVLPLEDSKAVHHINYFRMSAIPPHKLYTIKSSLYNSQMHVIPTQNPKFKLFLMSAAEYNQIKQPNNLDLFTYIRVFLKNVKTHNVANWKYVWVPQMSTRGHWAVRQYRSFLQKDIYAFDMINISYRQFIPGSLLIQPQHKDLVITPPFIVGILSVTLEQVSEGSPLYVRLLEENSLRAVESEIK